MFIAGNDAAAKDTVSQILNEFGWEVIDLGGIEASRYLEPLAETCVRGTCAAADDPARCQPDRVYDEHVTFISAGRMSCRGRHASGQWRMRPTIEINVPHTTALARKDHLVFMLDDMNAARVRIEKERAIAPRRIGTGPFDDDVGHTGGVRPSRLRTSSRSGPTSAPRTSSSSGRSFLRPWRAV